MSSTEENVLRWTEAGLFRPEKVLDRLGAAIIRSGFDRYALDHNRGLQDLFLSFAVEIDGKRRLTKAAFVRSLQGTGELSASSAGTEGGGILFDSLFYLSQVPFPPACGTPTPPGLTYDEMIRGLGFLLSDATRFLSSGMLGDSVESRVRTLSDMKRLLFQSLATTRDGRKLPYDVEEAKRVSWINAQHVWEHHDFVGPNHDEHGDEMFHDVVQVLLETLPHYSVCILGAWRYQLLPMAHELHDKNDLHLHHLTIPPARLKTLVKALLLGQYTPESRSQAEEARKFPDEELDAAATSIVNSFCHTPGIDITWPMWHATLGGTSAQEDAQIFLLQPIMRIIPCSFFNKSLSNDPEPAEMPDCGSEHVLNPSVMAQLCTVLLDTFWFPWLKCIHQQSVSPLAVTNASPPAIDSITCARAITKLLTEDPLEGAIVAISGKTTNNDKYTFAVSLAILGEDGQTIDQRDLTGGQCAGILQLSPVHDRFQGRLSKLAWQLDGDDILFGKKGKGASLMLTADLKHCVFNHVVISDAEVVYDATAWRGDWSVELDIETLEIWREIES